MSRYEAYYNLHKGCLSVRAVNGSRAGGVNSSHRVRHVNTAEFEDVKFAVQPAGRAKVLNERRKNVHAFVRGRLTNSTPFFSSDPYVPTYGNVWIRKDEWQGYEPFYRVFEPDDRIVEVTYNPYKYESFVIAETEQPIFESPRVLIEGRTIFAAQPTTPVV